MKEEKRMKEEKERKRKICEDCRSQGGGQSPAFCSSCPWGSGS